MLAFGKPVNTIYHLDQADVIVSLDADFLSCGPGNLVYARQYADKRRVMTNVTHEPQRAARVAQDIEVGRVGDPRDHYPTAV